MSKKYNDRYLQQSIKYYESITTQTSPPFDTARGCYLKYLMNNMMVQFDTE